jgi:hypothetical protein
MSKLLQKSLLPFLLLGCLLLASNSAKATHSMGLDLTYQCIGSNQYQINLTFYRDCNGITAPTIPSVNWTAACGSGTAQLQQISMQEITPACPGIVGTACNNGGGVYGIEEYKYQGVLTLPAGCTDITLSFQQCCRNNAITTLTNPGTESLYIEAAMSSGALCNNSPVFSNFPVPFGCVGQPVFYNHGALDPDGDILTYSIIDCYNRSGTPVIYNAGYSASMPLSTTGGTTINASTGAISFTPNIAQVGVLCVKVDEFRNGVLIGSVVRDIQFTSVACSNTVPTLSGVDNTTSYNASATVGSQLCFDVFSNDPDVNQTTNLAWNSGIASGTFTTTGSPFANGTFCWTPTAADVGTHTFTVTVADDYCPIIGQNTYTYTITVQGAAPCDSIGVNIVSYNDLSCSSNDGSAVIVASNGVGPYDYQLVNWTTGAFFSNNTGIFNNLTSGSYSVWVIDANGCTPACSGHTFAIGGNTTPLLATATATDVPCPSNSTNTIDSTNSGGSVTVISTGGSAPYLYSIDGISFQSSSSFSNLIVGTYTVVAMDANGCSVLVTAIVGEPDPISIGIVSLTSATCGQSNGSVTLQATGGDGVYFYYLSGQSQGSNPTFTGLAAGTYTFSVCDMNYCIYDTTIVIPGTGGFIATINGVSPSCNGDCNGAATTVVAGGSISANYTVSWNNNMTGSTISGLCAGTYTATVTDNNNCSTTATVTLTEPDAISVSLVASSDESCLGNDGAATLAVTGGTAPYNVDIANFSSATTYSEGTGVFTGLNGGQYVANVVDANGCGVQCAAHFALASCPNTTPAPTRSKTLGLSSTAPSLLVNPNPASTMVQVSFQASETNLSLMIIDGQGKSMFNKANLDANGSFELNVNNWPGSTYYVILRNTEGQVLKTKKLVIAQ